MNVYVRDLTRYLGRLGIHVDVFTRSQDEHVPHVLHDLGFGNRVVHVRSGPEVPRPKDELENYLPQFVAGIEDFSEIKDLKYDLIHSHYWLSGLAAGKLKSKWNVPVVSMFHTLGLMKQRVARNAVEAEGGYRIRGEKEVIKLSDRIVAATPAEMAQLQWLYNADGAKVEIIPPGVELSRFYPIPEDEAKEYVGIRPCDKMLLFVGRIEPLKGIDTLIKAIAIMREKDVDVCLAVIGGETDTSAACQNEEMERLKVIREQIGLADLVAFLGKRSQDTLPYYYSAAEAVVVPSHYESFGMVALEALACGAPVVASEVGGLAYLVQDGVTGFTVPSDDPEALAGKLIVLLQDKKLREQMCNDAVEFVQNYSWQEIAARVAEMYREVIGKDLEFANIVG